MTVWALVQPPNAHLCQTAVKEYKTPPAASLCFLIYINATVLIIYDYHYKTPKQK